ncbi:MAG: transglutaminase N-terminal domain-containing protein [Candidatus Binatia bacterium]
MNVETPSGTFAYRVEHETRYEYDTPVATSQHAACLRPRDLPGQRLRWYRLHIDPEAADRTARLDYFGNTVEQFSILGSHSRLLVHSSSLVEITPQPFYPASASPPWEGVRDDFVYRKGAPGRPEAEFVFSSPIVPVEKLSREYGRESFWPGRPLLEAAEDLMHRMYRDFTFDAEATTVSTPVLRVLAERRGVCQDLAHVMISCLRSLGLPARYVSGYLLTDPPAGEERMLGADASHAWVSVHCPGAGWVDLDPTNDVRPDHRHVVVGWGRDYGDVCPLRGAFVGGEEHSLEIAVSVIPLDAGQLERALGEATSEPALGFPG